VFDDRPLAVDGVVALDAAGPDELVVGDLALVGVDPLASGLPHRRTGPDGDSSLEEFLPDRGLEVRRERRRDVVGLLEEQHLDPGPALVGQGGQFAGHLDPREARTDDDDPRDVGRRRVGNRTGVAVVRRDASRLQAGVCGTGDFTHLEEPIADRPGVRHSLQRGRVLLDAREAVERRLGPQREDPVVVGQVASVGEGRPPLDGVQVGHAPGPHGGPIE